MAGRQARVKATASAARLSRVAQSRLPKLGPSCMSARWFENLVYLVLRRKTADISYWKGKAVAWGLPKARHEDALEAFYRQFPHANEAILATPDSFDELADREL